MSPLVIMAVFFCSTFDTSKEVELCQKEVKECYLSTQNSFEKENKKYPGLYGPTVEVQAYSACITFIDASKIRRNAGKL